MYFMCYFEQNGCGKKNTREVTPDIGGGGGGERETN